MSFLQTVSAAIQTKQPEATNSFSVPHFGGDNKASDTWAWITRRNWQDYQDRFVPLEDELLNMTTYNNPGLARQEVSKGVGAVDTALDTSNRMQDQYFSRYGAAVSDDQRQVRQRMRRLQRGAAVTDAANRIRQRLIDQNRAIALGASSTAVQSGLDREDR